MNSKQLLSNGYFNKADLSDMHNMLLMASLANDVYPWSKQYNIHLLDVADGLNNEQVGFLKFQQPTAAAAAPAASVLLLWWS
jgi:hypothetical protein